MKDLEPLPLSDKISGAPHPSEATTILGQDSAQQQFLNAFDRGRLHHAWLLSAILTKNFDGFGRMRRP